MTQIDLDYTKTIRIIGCDPGTTYTGVAILELRLPDLEIVSIKTHLIDMYGITNPLMLNTDLQSRLNYLYGKFNMLLNYVNPFSVSIESPFINRFRPQAVVPLSQSLMALELAAMHHNPYLMITKYPPSTIKNAVGAKGGADKIGVLDALWKVEEVSKLINLNNITEHEVDGIAIAYTNLRLLRNNKVLLCL